MGQLTPYNKRQLAIVEKFRGEMEAAGGLLPSWWQHSSAYEIAKAAVNAGSKTCKRSRAGEGPSATHLTSPERVC